jgi:DNA repair protein RAD57
LLDVHPYLSTLPRDHAPSLENILSINAMDLESQDHILNYQLPVAISRYNIGLVVIDSITANYRAELSSSGLSALSMRSGELSKLGHMLRNLAVSADLAVVVANQVSDRFDPVENLSFLRGNHINSTTIPTGSQQHSPIPHNRPEPAPASAPPAGNVDLLSQHVPASSPFPSSSPFVEEDPQQQQQPQFDGSYLVGNPVRNEILSLIHQQRFFTGWGDTLPFQQQQHLSALPSTPAPHSQKAADKTPALGFVWSSQIACRIALKKESAVGLSVDGNIRQESVTDKIEELNKDGNQEDREEANTTRGIGSEPPLPSTSSSLNDMGGQQRPQQQQSEPAEPVIKRTMKMVFAPWSAGLRTSISASDGDDAEEVEFKIWKGGVSADVNN